MTKFCVTVLVSVFTSFAWGLNHQDELAKAQTWVNSFERPYPIIVIDRDKINFLIKSNQAAEDVQKSYSLVKGLIEQESEFTISEKDYQSLEPYLKVLTNTATALPILQGFTGEYKFCAVIANPPNGNAELESNRIAGFEHEEAFHDHPNLNYKNLNAKMSLKELYLFSLYHESAHCLDQTFIVEALKGHTGAHGVHKAETYAELMAYLALVPELGTGVASKRAAYRSVYSRIVGKHLTTQNHFSSPYAKSGGATYNLGPYLLKAQELLYFKEVDLRDSTDKVATGFVKDYVMNSREFKAIITFLQEGHESSNKKYSQLAFEHPQLFNSAHLTLTAYQSQTNYILQKAFTVRPAPKYDKLPSLDLYRLCSALNSKDQEAYLNILNDYRSSINDGVFEPKKIKAVYDKLNNADFSCRFT